MERKKTRLALRKVNKRQILLGGIVLLILPALILFGSYLLENQQYYLIGTFMIVLILIPFFMRFETRDAKVSEIVTLACMSGLAVASRVVFAPLPQIKPMASIVIITGICFGMESGFLTGAVAVFLSNLYFGHGLWTPYQIFGMALLGGIAGLLFQEKNWEKHHIIICLYGGIATLVLYGGIVNLSSVLIPGQAITHSFIQSIYLLALPFDLLHAVSTIVFLTLLLKPMMRILQRIKKKYGILL